MKLGLINASPRGKSSNSAKIGSWLTRDLPSDVEKITVNAVKAEAQATAIEKIMPCDYYVVIFPLYTDAMPGITKQFLEGMMDNKVAFSGKPIFFIIHSGFPEAAQSRMLERYVAHYTKLMDMAYMGCIIWGGSEAIRFAPEEAFAKRADVLAELGLKIPSKTPFTKAECRLPGHQEKLPKSVMFFLKHIGFVSDIMWNRMLKKNGAYKNRFDRPYQP